MEKRAWRIFEDMPEEGEENIMMAMRDIFIIAFILVLSILIIVHGLQRLNLQNALLFYDGKYSRNLSDEEIILMELPKPPPDRIIAKKNMKAPQEKPAADNPQRSITKKKYKKIDSCKNNSPPKKCVCLLSAKNSFNRKTPPYPTDSYIEKTIKDAARKEKFPEDVLWSIVSAESDFKFDATSDEGAVGPAQVTAIAAKQINMSYDRAKYDIPYNLTISIKYMKYLKRNYVDRDWPQLNESDRWKMTAYYYNLGPHGSYNNLRNLGFDRYNLTRFNQVYSGNILGYESYILLSRYNERLAYIRETAPEMGTTIACEK